MLDKGGRGAAKRRKKPKPRTTSKVSKRTDERLKPMSLHPMSFDAVVLRLVRAKSELTSSLPERGSLLR